jgi:hypothetical protein
MGEDRVYARERRRGSGRERRKPGGREKDCEDDQRERDRAMERKEPLSERLRRKEEEQEGRSRGRFEKEESESGARHAGIASEASRTISCEIGRM